MRMSTNPVLAHVQDGKPDDGVVPQHQLTDSATWRRPRDPSRGCLAVFGSFPPVAGSGSAATMGPDNERCPSMRRHRACRAPRTEGRSDTREVYTMALAHIPNGGD